MTESETIVITKRDLKDPHIEDMIMAQQAARRQLTPAERAPVETAFWMNPVFYTAVAGFFGAFIAWAFSEPFIVVDGSREERGLGIWMMLITVPTLIGLFVGLIEGIMSRNFWKALRCGGIGVGIGLVWGICGTILGGIAMSIVKSIALPIFRDSDGNAAIFSRPRLPRRRPGGARQLAGAAGLPAPCFIRRQLPWLWPDQKFYRPCPRPVRGIFFSPPPWNPFVSTGGAADSAAALSA